MLLATVDEPSPASHARPTDSQRRRGPVRRTQCHIWTDGRTCGAGRGRGRGWPEPTGVSMVGRSEAATTAALDAARIARWTALHRAACIALLVLAAHLQTPFDSSPTLQLQLDATPPTSSPRILKRLASPFLRWDTLHFLGIASPRPLPASDVLHASTAYALQANRSASGLRLEHSLAFQPAILWMLRLAGYRPLQAFMWSAGGDAMTWDPAQAVLLVSILAAAVSSFSPALLYWWVCEQSPPHRAILGCLLNVVRLSFTNEQADSALHPPSARRKAHGISKYPLDLASNTHHSDARALLLHSCLAGAPSARATCRGGSRTSLAVAAEARRCDMLRLCYCVSCKWHVTRWLPCLEYTMGRQTKRRRADGYQDLCSRDSGAYQHISVPLCASVGVLTLLLTARDEACVV